MNNIMKKKKIKNIIKIIIINICMLIFMNSFVFATNNTSNSSDTAPDGANANPFSIAEVIKGVKNFTEMGKKTSAGVNADEVSISFAEQIRPFGEILIAVGGAICIGATMFIGGQYLLATGNPSDLAKAKDKLIAFAIASAIFFAAYPIWTLTIDVISGATSKIIS